MSYRELEPSAVQVLVSEGVSKFEPLRDLVVSLIDDCTRTLGANLGLVVL